MQVKVCGCSPATEFASLTISKNFECGTDPTYFFTCLGGCTPCDPETGVPCESIEDCEATEIQCCVNGTTEYTFTCESTFCTLGSGHIEFQMDYNLELCDTPSICPQPVPMSDGIKCEFGVEILKNGTGTTVILNEVASTNMDRTSDNQYSTNDSLTGAGSVSLELDFSDHDNPDNDGIWEEGCKYTLVITGTINSVNNTGTQIDVAMIGTAGFTVDGLVTSDCYTGTETCEDVD